MGTMRAQDHNDGINLTHTYTMRDGKSRSQTVYVEGAEVTYELGTNTVTGLKLEAGDVDANITFNNAGELTITRGDVSVTGREAERIIQRVNNGQSFVEALQNTRLAAYERSINPFFYDPNANDIVRTNSTGEVVAVDTDGRSVQIMTEKDQIWDRSVRYRSARVGQDVVETWSQDNWGETRNFYEIRTTSNGTETARLHTFDAATGTYTSAPVDIETARRDRDAALTAIRGDDTLESYGMSHGQGILEQAATVLRQQGSSFEDVVMPVGGFTANQNYSRDRLEAITRDARSGSIIGE